MNNRRVAIPIVVGIIIVIVGIVVMSNQGSDRIEVEDILDKELRPDEENAEIQEKLDEIEKIKLENEYSPKPRNGLHQDHFKLIAASMF